MQSILHRIAIVTARLAGTAALILGILLWLGHGGALVHAHMGSGALLVLSLWLLSLLALKAAPGRALLGIVWGLAVLALGLIQGALFPGDLHWLVQGAHLALGISAMVQTERLAALLAPAQPR